MSHPVRGRLAAVLLVSASLITLTACSKPAEEAAMTEEAVPADAVADAAATVESPARTDPASVPQLAYDYTFDLSAPDKQVRGMMEGHQEACTLAGPSTCQVLSLNSRSDGHGSEAFHTLTLRATPQWIGMFRKNLSNELKATGAKIESQSIATEDVSLSIIDQEAHIQNQIALRDNLQATLRTHKGKMSEVIELKQQLASIQSDIDSARTSVATMKKRVAMSKLTLTYRSASAVAVDGTWAPLSSAVADLGPNMVSVLTVMVTVTGYLLPLGLIAAPVVWWLRRRKTAKIKA
ncbi:MAG: DUF4349 domain-containing protein [Asticcacaulis sp.]